MNYKLIAYALDFTSYLLQSVGNNAKSIQQIILFGSVARGDATSESDIDIFIETSDHAIENKCKSILEEFLQSVKVQKYWKLFGITNEIHCQSGKLKEWPNLQRSISANGITLYGKSSSTQKTIPYFLFTLTPSKNRNKNMSVWRSLYGYTQKIGSKRYTHQGLILELFGKKLANGIFIIPAQSLPHIIEFLKKKKFQYTLTQIWLEDIS